MCGSEGEIVGFIHVPSLRSEVGTGVRGSIDILFLFPHKRKIEAGNGRG